MTESRYQLMRRMAGFTLIEAVVSIVITGVLAAVVALFIQKPVEGYLAGVRRAELTDAADASLRRIARDVRMALPNSLREPTGALPTNTGCIEFIPVVGGGRYRYKVDASGNGAPFPELGPPFPGPGLPSTTGVISFDVLAETGVAGLPVGTASYYVVVNNTGTISTDPAALDAYQPSGAHSNKRLISPPLGAAAVTVPATQAALNITLAAGDAFTNASTSGHHFQVIGDSSVTYSCPGDGKLYRTSRFLSAAATAYATCPMGAATDVLVGNVTSCSLLFVSVSGAKNYGLLTMKLAISDPTAPAETIQLYNEVHFNNAP